MNHTKVPSLKTTSPPHILLVEDNPIALSLAEVIITKLGYYSMSAKDGEQALQLVKDMPFNLIITDIGLPGISGIELCQEIRAYEHHNQIKCIPIVGLTAQISQEEQQACLKAGMQEVFIKPLHLQMMQEMVAKFLSSNGQLEQTVTPGIGPNLPDYEFQLFELTPFALLDIAIGIKYTGNLVIYKDLLAMMVNDALPEDEAALKKAYQKKEYTIIKALAHKVRGNAIYCGTIKLQKASQYVEYYLKAQHKKLLDQLCIQLLEVIYETQVAIKDWLSEATKE
ncbi:sensory box histidine kinase/response regulator [Legionella beliardensis]|uniref:Sensory box histidine kinase/response regulator n=1 Tax=Legionella beliardensis TaxID=91822 RepID=A0A378I3L1_9GAMM|nr:response regulator [Legionella beliardensis]STX29452.1 sensory box histidine kinase/response regulator [Legionella beliardensis]